MELDEIKKELEEIKRVQTQELENRKKLAKALVDLSKRFEEHTSGGLTLDDIQKCMERVQQLVGVLESAGMIGRGEGSSNMLATLMAQMLKQNTSTDTQIERAGVDSKKIKKMLEEDDDEDEG